jgi:hypothetical protein
MVVAVGRAAVGKPYLLLENDRSNLRRLGYADQELNNGSSYTLIDALVAQPDPAGAAAVLSAHLAAGTEHVCVHAPPDAEDPPPPHPSHPGPSPRAQLSGRKRELCG